METELSAIKWCQTNGLLAKDKMSACNGLMEIRERNSETNKRFYFRCTVRSCRKEISVLVFVKIPFLKVPTYL